MRELLEFLVLVMRPVFLAVGFIIRWFWKLLFSWWLEPLLDRRYQESLQEDIRRHIPFLFFEHDAAFLPDVHKSRYGEVEAVIQMRDFRIKFSRFRDQHDVLVASNKQPDLFQEITAFLDNADFRAGRRRNPGVPYSYSSWTEAGWILQQNWDRLTKALSI
jgi:hypothetical protein